MWGGQIGLDPKGAESYDQNSTSMVVEVSSWGLRSRFANHASKNKLPAKHTLGYFILPHCIWLRESWVRIRISIAILVFTLFVWDKADTVNRGTSRLSFDWLSANEVTGCSR